MQLWYSILSVLPFEWAQPDQMYPGSVCLVVENSIFSGDTLFQRSCGRTDLPGGDWDTICASLKRLGALEGNYFVHPGHGGATTLAEERRFNPYIRG